MKKITLEKLQLTNFKGVKSFTLDAAGGNVKVYGDNATGKTSLADAFVWLLFDKDTSNQKEFGIKQVDENNKVIHGLDHEVSAVLRVDGKTIQLSKLYKEKWTKHKGNIESVMTGHTTEYSVNGVPQKKTEYTKFIEKIADEEVFKLLTNPSYFNEQLKWEKRREILMEVCGDVTDEDVIDSNTELASLLGVLEERAIEDHKKVVASSKKKINDELERIPVRIDELNKGMADLSDLNEAEINEELQFFKTEINRLEDQKSDIRNGASASEKKNKLYALENELQTIKHNHTKYMSDQTLQVEKVLNEAKRAQQNIQYEIQDLGEEKNRLNGRVNFMENERKQLLEKYHSLNGQEFEFSQECSCPACGQDLPEDKLNAAREKSLEQFNLSKANELDSIKEKGVSLKADIQKASDRIAEIKSTIEQRQKDQQIEADHIAKYQKELADIKDGLVPVEEVPAYQDKLKEITSLKEEISNASESVADEMSEIQSKIDELKDQAEKLQVGLAKIKQHEQSRARIKELEDEERKLAKKFEQLNKEEFLMDEFVRTKVNLLEEKINSKFKHARFKLFKDQVNGGLAETCKTTFKGVEYDAGLNNAARINVGLDIINTLSEHYGLSAPIFVDNSEAVTKIIDTNAQMINLLVSEQDKKLRVETEALQEVI
ncbi:hypothetical protein KP77_25440 [Jeotgalibacillus alimentarius]|uniref:Nuclease SbcCD subunit C n=1 Tax=Jeotgalibacillus alimentarius TaxID=135826 RepID=A0A0C2R9H5_9BACL|nr:hypothetical protein [Jeotgalibacillus alimentarius]KIL46975.1 hypothetical protein KP77_25440 [Jeotgalibacillus alimentarius]